MEMLINGEWVAIVYAVRKGENIIVRDSNLDVKEFIGVKDFTLFPVKDDAGNPVELDVILTDEEQFHSTEIETLQQENALLRAQNKALSERADFIEDVVAEMAMMIYQ